MRWNCVMTVVVGLLLASQASADDAQKDLDALQGTWKLVSAERDGKAIAADEVQKTRITFQKDTFDFPDAAGIGTSKKGTIKVDPTKKPKSMDATSSNADDKGKVSLGIYEINGDDYKVCFAPPGKERPTEFSSKAKSGHILQVWKRAKK